MEETHYDRERRCRLPPGTDGARSRTNTPHWHSLHPPLLSKAPRHPVKDDTRNLSPSMYSYTMAFHQGKGRKGAGRSEGGEKGKVKRSRRDGAGETGREMGWRDGRWMGWRLDRGRGRRRRKARDEGKSIHWGPSLPRQATPGDSYLELLVARAARTTWERGSGENLRG